MVNSGAIMSASILLYLLKPEMNMAQKYDYVFDFFKVINVSIFQALLIAHGTLENSFFLFIIIIIVTRNGILSFDFFEGDERCSFLLRTELT